MAGVRADANHTSDHRLRIGSHHLSEMVEHVRHWYPLEGCGLLATVADVVVEVYPGTNVAYSETFYEMDPKEVLAATRDIDEREIRLGAIFHSHPSTESYPSETDLGLIFDPEVYMIIISLAGAEPEVRAFRYDGDIHEVPIVIEDNPEGAAA